MAPQSRKPLLRAGISRRRLLQLGGIGFLGLTLPELLRASASPGPARSRQASEKSCIFILLCGGPSHLETFDPKPLLNELTA